MRSLVGVVLGVVARLWLATLRMRLELHPDLLAHLAAHPEVPWVLAFFHGTQWPLLGWPRRKKTLVMVSHSADGSMQARALAVLGFEVVRGSSSRGGARALAAIVRRVRAGDVDVAFAVDGPRGPYGVVKAGARLAARHTGAVLVPMGSAVASGHRFDRAWDRFALAWPFSRVAVVLGAPITPAVATAIDADRHDHELGTAIVEANGRAAGMLSAGSRNMLPLHGFSAASGTEAPSSADVFERN